MSDFMVALNRVNDAIFVSLVNTTVQIAILVPLIALLIRVFRIRSATTRYSLWLFALFAIIALPLITPFIPQIDMAQFRSQRTAGNRPDDLVRLGVGGAEAGQLPEDGDPVPSVGTAKVHANRGSDVSLINPVSIAYFIWCTGAVFMSCMITCAYRKLRKLGLTSPDVKDSMTIEMLSQLKRRIGIRRSVALRASPGIYTPMSIGFLSPVIIVPNSVIDDGSREQLEMILTHELAHIKRNDYLVNLLQNMMRVVFFFHPLFHLMNRSLARECEHICDDWVILMTSHRSRYAECLIDMLERVVSNPVNIPVTVAMAERKQDVPGRIDMIVDKTRKTATKVPRKALLALLLIGCLSLPVLGGIGLVRFAGARPASSEGQIIFSRVGSREGLGIWVMDADGGKERHLTFGGERGDVTPAWSPDGRQIAFSRWEDWDDPNLSDIYLMNADGSNMKRLTEALGNDIKLTWSPDGKRMAFQKGVWVQKDWQTWIQEGWAIYVMNADGSNLKCLVENQGRVDRDSGNPAWSPDGRKIAYHCWFGDRPSVWVMDPNGENQKMLYHWGEQPDWSPNGDKLVFTSSQDSGNNWPRNDIYIMDADGENVTRLTQPGPARYNAPEWSPDGTKIAFSSYEDEDDSPADIYVMNADGSNVEQLTNTTEWESSPDWTAFSYGVEPAGKLKSTWGKIKVLLRPH